MATPSKHFKNADKTTAQTLQLYLRCITIFGTHKVHSQLKSLITQHQFSITKNNTLVEYILTSAVEAYKEHNISREDIVNSAKRGAVIEAKKICIILIKKHVKISNVKLANFLNRDNEEFVYRSLRAYNYIDRNTNVKAVKEFIKKFDEVSARVDKYISGRTIITK